VIETTIYGRLSASATITGLVAERIYPTDPEEAAPKPFVVHKVTDSAPVTTLAGVTPVTAYVVDLDIWAATIADAGTLATAAAGQLHCYRGGAIVESMLADQSSEEFADAEEGELYHVHQTYHVLATATTAPPGWTVVLGNDATVRLVGLADEDGNPVTTATVTGLFNGTYSFSLTHTSGGDYAGTIPSAQTPTPGTFPVVVTAVYGGQTLVLSSTLLVTTG
jgi:hypothetical protein